MILSIGELLADLIGQYDSNNKMVYCRYPGGAPFNVIYQVNKLKNKCGFIGNVGDDIIGRYLKQFGESLGFYYTDISLDDKHNTTLAFVDIDKTGERHFCFNRFNSSDYYISSKQLDVIKYFDIIHVGSLMLRESLGVKLFDEICEKAKKENKLISFDVNYRDDIFNSKSDAISIYRKCIEKADIVKLSLEEIEIFTNSLDYKNVLSQIVRSDQLVVVTLGKNGSYLKYKEIEVEQESENVKVVDTTGAGDCFYGTFLSLIDECGIDNLNIEKAKEILKIANHHGAICCTYVGALNGSVKN